MSGYFSFVLLLSLVFYVTTINQKDNAEGLNMIKVDDTTNVEHLVENADIIIEEVESIVSETEIEEVCPVVEETEPVEASEPVRNEDKPRK